MTEASETRQRLVTIAESLLAQTQSRRVDWRIMDDEDAFLYSGSNSSVIADWIRDPDGDRIYRMRILNSRGTEIERLQQEWHAQEQPSDPTDPWGGNPPLYIAASWNATLERLHQAGRRSALQIDSVLDSLLGDLGNPF